LAKQSQTESYGIPTGLAHIGLILKGTVHVHAETAKYLNKHEAQLELLGADLSALYQAATCHRKCHGHEHILEALAGRAYNLSIAAYNLTLLGLYDEALNLTRGIGEISNLVWLSVVDSTAIKEWIKSDDKTRRNKFGPARVRAALEKCGVVHAYADADWYSDLCEKYVHVTPGTQPNKHDDTSGFVGGKYQEAGFKKALEGLTGITSVLALLICRYFKFDDLFDQIKRAAGSNEDDTQKV
jgi:hypothetical protein